MTESRIDGTGHRVTDTLSPDLRHLVKRSVALLGEIIREELGKEAYLRIEHTRRTMTKLRGAPIPTSVSVLRRELGMLRKLSTQERADFARSYTLMLELMNACENAYRSHRIRSQMTESGTAQPDAIIYVLTAHPTEARSPQNIWVFHQIQLLLTRILDRSMASSSVSEDSENFASLRHWIEIAWRTAIVREQKPRVRDEAEQIYSTLLRDETLRALFEAGRELAPIYIRSWVGGDKDGHPGVDEKAFIESLQLSRRGILGFISRRLTEVHEAAEIIDSTALISSCRKARELIFPLRAVRAGDAKRVHKLREQITSLLAQYNDEVGAPHPALIELRQLLRVFPAFVVPLEFRESSDVLLSQPEGRGLAILRMLKELGAISNGGDPRWYVRGFIVSMTESFEHLRAAAHLVDRVFGETRIPVIPLFEQAGALDRASTIVREMLSDRHFRRTLEKNWGGYLEVMVGYSDSSKESGVLPSRLKIADTMHSIDRLCSKEKVTPLFFQGSGGSVDRGGGSIQEQTAWWPSGALRNYKVTIQGEMIERSLASPEITRRQIERIAENAGRWKNSGKKPIHHAEALKTFAARVAERYRSTIREPEFLRIIECATPYRSLGSLNIGSRPTKRTTTVSVSGLRAIPWVLCWTQTRVLFPTWWGIGTAWSLATARERASLRRSYAEDPLFSSYIRALGFTLAKVELPIWRIYLEESGLAADAVERAWSEFVAEHRLALDFARKLLDSAGKRSSKKPSSSGLLGWRPWLEESIILRAPMIHPLNLLQILAIHDRDMELLRITTVGISSGMMTTG